MAGTPLSQLRAGMPDEARLRRTARLAALVELGLLAGFSYLTVLTLLPGYRGGHFVTLVLALGVMLLAFLVIRRLLAGRAAGRPWLAEDREAAAAEEGAVLGLGWGVLIILGYVVLVVAIGVSAGTLLMVGLVARLHGRLSWTGAALLAAALALPLPYGFSYGLNIGLWTGAVPELVPGWLGGGLLPPV